MIGKIGTPANGKKYAQSISQLEGDIASKVSTSDIVNDITTGGTSVPLAAEQGKTLAASISQLAGEVTTFNNRVDQIITTPVLTKTNLTMRPIFPKQHYVLPIYDSELWTPSNLVLSYDYHIPLDSPQPLKCLKVTMNNNGTAYTSVPNIDITNKVLYAITYIHPDGWENILGYDIDFFSSGQTSSNYRLRKRIYLRPSILGLVNNGWVLTSTPIEHNYENKGELFDVTNITRVQINTWHYAGTTPSVSFATLAIVEPLLSGGVVNVVDNFDEDVPLMAEYAASKGVKLSLSVIPDAVGKIWASKQHATLSQIKECIDMGHFVFNHTWDHRSFGTLTDEEILASFLDAKKYMEENELGYGASVMSVPGAYFTTEAANILLPITDGIYHKWNSKYNLWTPYYPASKCIYQTSLDSEPTINAIDSAISAATYKSIAVNGYHGTYWDIDNGASWKAYIDELASIEGIKYYGLDDIMRGNFK